MVVPQGSFSANFTITTAGVSALTTATVTAAYGGYSKTANVSVNIAPAATLKSIVLNPSTVIGAQTNGTNSTGTVTLTSPAPVGGVVIALASSNSGVVSVPSTVTIPAGATSTTFAATTFNVTSTQAITISAVYSFSKLSATLTVNPWLYQLSLSPGTLVGGANSTATLTLNQVAPVGGLPINLGCSNSSATIPDASNADGSTIASGVLTIPAGKTTAVFTVNTLPVALAGTVNITAAYSGLTLSQTLNLQTLLQRLQLSTSSVTGGTSLTGTVYLNGPAPTGGVGITLGSDNAAATFPNGGGVSGGVLTIAAGVSSGSFTIATNAVTSVTNVNLSAAYGGVTAHASFTINPTQVTLQLTPPSVVGGATVDGVVTISSAAPAGGLSIALSTFNATVAPVPSQITIAAGATSSAHFSIVTTTVTSTQSGSITAAYGGLQSSQTLTVKPLLASVSINPNPVVGGVTTTGTVALNGPAPAGVSLTLSSNDTTAATVPSSIPVTQGATNATFTVTTFAVSTNKAPTITASYGGANVVTTLTVRPMIQSLGLNPQSVYGGGTSTGTVTLTGLAPTGGVAITLASATTSVATILNGGNVSGGVLTIPAGSSIGTFTINTSSVSVSASSVISATYTSGSSSQVVTQTLTVIPLISSVSVSPNPLVGGGSGTGTVTLAGPAPTGGIGVTLTSSVTGAATIANIGNVSGGVLTIPAGSNNGGFTVNGGPVTTSSTTLISAAYNGASVSTTLTVKPLLSSLTLTPTNIVGGDTANGGILFNLNAPAGVTLTISSSNNTVASVPATLPVTTGASNSSFTITSTAVSTMTPVTITVSYGGVALSKTLNVYPVPTVATVAISGLSEVVGGNNMTGQVTLSSIAPASGAVVSLSSGNTAVATVLSSISVSPGATQGSFTITTLPTATTATTAITAAYNSTTGSANVTVDRPSLTALNFAPSSLPGGNTTQGTLTLNGKAPTGGVTVDLSSSIPNGQNFLPSTSVVITAGLASGTFQLATSTVNAATTLVITATNHAYPTEFVTSSISLSPANIRAVDLMMPKGITLQWTMPAVGHYVLKRDGVLVATLPNTTQTYTEYFEWNSGQVYQYDLYDDNTIPAQLLSSERAAPYLVAATQNQAVDSRLDPRYSTAVFLDHNFGTSAYKGGLFAGFASDPSKVGRSFALFALNPPPAGGVFRTGSVNASLTTAYTDLGPVSGLQIGCQAIPKTIPGYKTWDPATLVWSNSPVVDPTLATQTVTVNYNPASPPPTPAWMSWKLNTDILDAILGINDSAHDGTNAMAVQWASMSEASNGWAYFAKTEYSSTAGPNVTNLWSIPTLVKLTVPSTVNLSGAATTSATGQLAVNGVGLQGSAVVSLSSSSSYVTFQASGTQAQAMTVTGLSNTFVLNVAKPSSQTTVTITATFGGVTKTATMTVNP
ncbi:hypothetical protein CCAX7_007920 [Capsulimonas corticalis]|uniref:Uncharacterized protein n=1 Tax=Capsulimonas corticalis TaxID=2219043 RepID=A0A402CTT8_9BACT|nr:hypothetical protein CCAX7_007920 [Capsulimonas corticalis]